MSEQGRWYLNVWSTGGCAVCGLAHRDANQYAHNACYVQMPLCDRQAVTKACDERKVSSTPRPRINGVYCDKCGDALTIGRAHGCLNDALATARAEIERLTSELSSMRTAFELERAVANAALQPPTLLDRAFRFLAGLSGHFNAPALSKQGKAEREAYASLCADMKAALRPAKEGE